MKLSKCAKDRLQTLLGMALIGVGMYISNIASYHQGNHDTIEVMRDCGDTIIGADGQPIDPSCLEMPTDLF